MKMITAAAAALLALGLGSAASAQDWGEDVCRDKLEQIMQLGILKDLLPMEAGVPRVTVDVAAWSQMPFGAKQKVAKCLNTIFLGENSGKSIRINFLDHTNHKVIARFPPYRE